MTAVVPRALVEAFYKAYAERDIDRVGEFLADDVTWTITGPVDLLRFCGTRHGKDAALDMMARVVPQVFHIFSFGHPDRRRPRRLVQPAVCQSRRARGQLPAGVPPAFPQRQSHRNTVAHRQLRRGPVRCLAARSPQPTTTRRARASSSPRD